MLDRLRPHRVEVFSSASDAPRSRRPADVVVLVASGAVLALAAWAATAPRRADALVADLLALLPDPIVAVLGATFALSTLAALGLVAGVAALARHRVGVARDLLLAAALAVPGVLVVLRFAGDDWAPSVRALLDLSPEGDVGAVARLALVAAVAGAAAPHLTRPLRRATLSVVVLATLGALAEGWASLAQVTASLAVGLAAAAVVHLVVGSPTGTPAPERVRDALADLGVTLDRLVPSPVQPWGPSLLDGTLDDGTAVTVKVFGRDAVQAQTASRAWRGLWYRDGGRAVGSRAQQVEHEALLLLMAARSGAPVPEVVAAGAGGANDAVLVTHTPAGTPLARMDGDDVDDATLAGIWSAVAALHGAGIAHSALSGESLVVSPEGVTVVDLGEGSLGADEQGTLADQAEVLAASTVAVGRDRGVAAALDALGADGLAALLPLLQGPALTRATRHGLRERGDKLKDLRAATATAAGVDVPDLVPLRRIKPQNLIVAVLVALAAWTLIGQLSDVGIAQIGDQLAQASWGWVVAGLVLCALAALGAAVAFRGAVPDHELPLGPTTALQLAVGFIQIAMPVSGGKLLLQVRFLQRFGVTAPTAVAESALVSVSGFVVQVVVLAVFVPLTGIDLTLSSGDGGSGGGSTRWILLACAVVVALGVAVVLGVPRLRGRVVPPVRAAVGSAAIVLRSGRRTARLLGGNLAYQLLLAAGLVASAASIGGGVTIGEALVVATVTSLFVGLVPVPGGVGVAEATLAAGLTAAGMDPTAALTAAIVYRMVSFYLPPIWGAVAMRWLTRREYL